MNATQTLCKGLFAGEALLITDEISRRYLTGFASSDGAVLLTANSAQYFLDFRYREMGSLAQKNGIIPADYQICDALSTEMLNKLLKNAEIHTLYYEEHRTTCAALERLKQNLPMVELRPVGTRIDVLRSRKTPEEITKIKEAQRLTEEAFSHVLNCIGPHVTEQELAAEIDCFFLKHGATSAFETILVSGLRTSLPHGKATAERLTKNAFVTMDFGAKLDGYCADMTRTVVYGRADEEMKNIYHTVLSAQQAAFDAIRADIPGRVVDEAARGVIARAGYKDCFGHSTGHSLGLEIHEAPNFSPSCNTLIPQGAVLSVEPGIYLNGRFGVRIEDIVCVTADGFENLTSAKKDLLEM